MNEVSGKTLGLFRRIADRTGVTAEAMFVGATSSPLPGKDPEYISWDEFCLLCRNARTACGSDQKLAEMGVDVLDLPEIGRFIRIIQLFASAKTIYWVNKRWSGPALFNQLINDLDELQSGLLRFTITIPPELADCPEFFHLNGGVMRAVPKIIGLPESFVELSISPRKCVYTIDPPPPITLWARLRRALSVIFSARTAIAELSAQQSLLLRRYKELQASRNDLELARDQAVTARLAAENALAVKSQFLATMSHELRTPLNGVLGMSELLLETPLDTEQREYATTVHHCGESLLHLISNVLDYSKLEAGKVTLEPSVFDVRQVVENVLDVLASQARSQGLELGVNFGDMPLWVESDPLRLQQVLLNLVGNAIKFTRKGEVFVAVEEVEQSHSQTTLRFSVRDTGIGIRPSFLPDLFLPFTQADGSNSRAFGGTGLGLAISKDLVECLGGSIEVESEPDVGTTFHFTIRAGLAKPPAEDSVLPPIGRYAALVVDDNPTNRLILSRTLDRWGLTVEAVGSGEEALQALARPFDLVILDLRMPGMTGLDLARAITAGASGAPKLLMLTASGDREHARKARDMGITAYLTKPFRQAHLHASIRDLLSGVAPRPLPAPKAASTPPAAARRGRVLVVDDNPINLRIAQQSLLKIGYDVTCVASGDEAIERVSAEPFDFVFMDCEMPGKDGFDTTIAIRKLESCAKLPIVALTAHATDDVRARCTKVGMNDFVAKPPSLDTLRGVLKRWIEP